MPGGTGVYKIFIYGISTRSNLVSNCTTCDRVTMCTRELGGAWERKKRGGNKPFCFGMSSKLKPNSYGSVHEIDNYLRKGFNVGTHHTYHRTTIPGRLLRFRVNDTQRCTGGYKSLRVGHVKCVKVDPSTDYHRNILCGEHSLFSILPCICPDFKKPNQERRREKKPYSPGPTFGLVDRCYSSRQSERD